MEGVAALTGPWDSLNHLHVTLTLIARMRSKMSYLQPLPDISSMSCRRTCNLDEFYVVL